MDIEFAINTIKKIVRRTMLPEYDADIIFNDLHRIEKDIAQKEARIVTLEEAIKKWFLIYPCEHLPETYFDNKDCAYCDVVQNMSKLISEENK